MALDFDWRVTQLQEQPYTLSFQINGKARRYTPDVLAVFNDGKAEWTVVYEVKGHEDLVKNWVKFRPRFKAAVHDCRAKGWRFRIVTERDIRTPYVKNVKFLRRYLNRDALTLHEQALMQKLATLGETTPQALLAATCADEAQRLPATAELWRLVATRKIGASLTTPLCMLTPIRVV